MRRLYISILAFFPLVIWAQTQPGLHLLPNTYQSTFTNPAFMQRARVQIITPLTPTSSFGLYHSGFTLEDALVDYNADSLRFDTDGLIAGLNPTNHLELRGSFVPLAVAIKVRDKVQVGVHFANYTNVAFSYNDDLPELILRGNGPYLDQTLDIAPGFDFTNYTEVGVSVATKLNDKLQVGGRIKLWGGVVNVSSDPDASNVSLYTSPEAYQLTLTTDYRLRAASVVNIAPGALLDSLLSGGEVAGNFDAGDIFGFGNLGVGLDLGVQFQPIDNLTLNASIVNLGRINWDSNAGVFQSQGALTFEGLDPFDADLSSDTSFTAALEESFTAFLDTTSSVFDFDNADETSYSAGPPTRFYLSGSYSVLEKVSVGAGVFGESYRGTSHQTFMVNASFMPARMFNIGAHYAFNTRYGSTVGMQSRINLGPVQLFFAVNNVLAPFTLPTLRNIDFAGGVNLAFGRTRE